MTMMMIHFTNHKNTIIQIVFISFAAKLRTVGYKQTRKDCKYRQKADIRAKFSTLYPQENGTG
jgi:hypothetical protein